MQVNLEITSTTTGKKKQTTNITHVNPNTPNAVLKTFAQNLIGLTTNTFNTATRITENDVDSGGGAKITPTLSISGFEYDGYAYTATITYTGDGILLADTNETTSYANITDSTLRIKANAATFSGTLYATEGATYAAKSIDFQNT